MGNIRGKVELMQRSESKISFIALTFTRSRKDIFITATDRRGVVFSKLFYTENGKMMCSLHYYYKQFHQKALSQE